MCAHWLCITSLAFFAGKWNIGQAYDGNGKLNKDAMPQAGTYGIEIINYAGWPNGTLPAEGFPRGKAPPLSAFPLWRYGPVPPVWYGRDGPVFDLAVHYIRNVARGPFYLNVWPMTPHRPVPRRPGRINIGDGNISYTPLSDRFRRPDGMFKFSSDGTQRVEFDRARFGDGMRARFEAHDRNRLKPDGGRFQSTEAGPNTSLAAGMANYLGELWGLDVHVGRVLRAIDEIGARDNTLVLFTSDHGPEQSRESELGSTGLCRGGKQDLWEGGLRLPYIVRWPGGNVRAGRVDGEIVVGNIDWAPSILHLARVPAHRLPLVDGTSVAEAWRHGQHQRRPRAGDNSWWAWRGNNAITCRDTASPLKYRFSADGLGQMHEATECFAVFDVHGDPGEQHDLLLATNLSCACSALAGPRTAIEELLLQTVADAAPSIADRRPPTGRDARLCLEARKRLQLRLQHARSSSCPAHRKKRDAKEKKVEEKEKKKGK